MNTIPKGIVDNRGSATDHHIDEYGPIIAKYGKPDRDDSTENDVPRPPIVTRIVEYRPENVKIAFVGVENFADSPPFLIWRVIGYIDLETDSRMSSIESSKRLRSRLR